MLLLFLFTFSIIDGKGFDQLQAGLFANGLSQYFMIEFMELGMRHDGLLVITNDIHYFSLLGSWLWLIHRAEIAEIDTEVFFNRI